MKHLLILLISILLLSSPVIGDNHKGETLYLWGKYPDYVWKGFGDKDTHSVYKGDVVNVFCFRWNWKNLYHELVTF